MSDRPEPVLACGRELRPERSITRDSDLLLLHHAIASNGSLSLDKADLTALRRTSDRLHQLLGTCPWQLTGFEVLLWPRPELIAFTLASPITFYRFIRHNHKLLRRNEQLDFAQMGKDQWLEFSRLP